ncbi:MAG: hypothetical protein ACRDOK_15320 [Streptosporangiaceae bacterium]
MTPAEREARWTLGVWFALKADSNARADTALRGALARLDPQLPLRAEPVLHPRDRRRSDHVWVAETEPDLSFFEQIDPDDAKTRCATVQGHFPVGTMWDVPVNNAHYARREWPTEIFSRRPGIDDVLLHPAVLGVKIFCDEKTTT